MALSITPTSGAGPYTMTIDLVNKSLIDDVQYALEARLQDSVGSCVVPGGPDVPVVSSALLNNGFYVRTPTVQAGNCVTYKVDIVDLATSAVISTQSVSIDNV